VSFQQPAIKTDMLRIFAWVLFFPSLMLWPLLSILPLFSLLANTANALQTAINLLLFITGFWPAITIISGYRVWRNFVSSGSRMPDGTAALALGGIATVWTVIYLIVAIARL
jgi:hypothetical protein